MEQLQQLIEQVIQQHEIESLDWLVPLGAGALIILVALLVSLIRGMTGGVLVALIVGGLMTMSSIILDSLERRDSVGDEAMNVVSGLSRDTADLAKLNHSILVDLSRVMNSMRLALDGITPVLEPQTPTAGVASTAGADVTAGASPSVNNDAVERFKQSLSQSADSLSGISSNISNGDSLIDRIEAGLEDLDPFTSSSPSEGNQN
ncbi:MAG: hypothetical protein AAGJ94_04070 [Pseudomonadota bacterium]